MIPLKVRYTGLELDPMDILNPRLTKGPIDPSWTRVRFVATDCRSIDKIDRWISANIEGRWASYLTQVAGNYRDKVVVVAFENVSDAVMFALKDGETEWKNPIPRDD